MAGERDKRPDIVIATPENVTVSEEQTVIEWNVESEGIDHETTAGLIEAATGGKVISKEEAEAVRLSSGSTTYSTGFSRRNTNPARATWNPTGPKKGPWKTPGEDDQIQ